MTRNTSSNKIWNISWMQAAAVVAFEFCTVYGSKHQSNYCVESEFWLLKPYVKAFFWFECYSITYCASLYDFMSFCLFHPFLIHIKLNRKGNLEESLVTNLHYSSKQLLPQNSDYKLGLKRHILKNKNVKGKKKKSLV